MCVKAKEWTPADGCVLGSPGFYGLIQSQFEFYTPFLGPGGQPSWTEAIVGTSGAEEFFCSELNYISHVGLTSLLKGE